MKLLFVRHGKAGEREDWKKTGKSDDLRPLTLKGEEEMREIAKRLQQLDDSFEEIYFSPLTRTAQTAEILKKEFKIKSISCDDLKFVAEPEELLEFMKKLKKNGSYIFVGHDPSLSVFITLLLAGRKASSLTLKKGAAALVTCDGLPSFGSCTLEWLIQPKQLLD